MFIAHASRLAAPLVAALLVGGCTAGEIVDANFNPHPIGRGSLTFVGVDDNHLSNGREYVYYFNGDTSTTGAYVSFDSYSDDNMADTSGLRNSKVPILEGSYYIELTDAARPAHTIGVSPIFQHTYDGSGCTDGLNPNQHDSFCALYYFQLTTCPGAPPCTGYDGCVGPPLATHNGTKVVPLCQNTSR